MNRIEKTQRLATFMEFVDAGGPARTTPNEVINIAQRSAYQMLGWICKPVTWWQRAWARVWPSGWRRFAMWRFNRRAYRSMRSKPAA